MREIKFRVYDKDTKMMHICGEDIHDEISFTNEDNRAYYYNLQNGYGSLTEKSSYILMQYTGLKDKNGKEIYEGDIVQQYNIKANGIIIYKYGQFGTNALGMFWDIHSSQTEVIGNIYDNPDLLEVKDE